MYMIRNAFRMECTSDRKLKELLPFLRPRQVNGMAEEGA